ncbi:hypothetical protein EEO29_02730 [Staphylococcus pseudintermedius]|uniref:hypothetical protein n=1 Tax=Staphylococcus pseudintermedius TaxID=283734 RepID=UPI00143FA60C|nr:hypothetical protein [Staphylococcus pseudintermedius]EGQ3407838.1 hypothetical protein [Staphylococcus pseudintermedius]EGQ4401172.1 hypothetical protein [Staphylococcus pseudintermedius]EHT8056064.1 hypothetical protein [Staphylococcus pseudintermedius]EIE3609398.1 hypothetical protein [Staphylococcus pseudintermedius]EJA1858554.1 hypothetical protein [Staphylococcus pseudintermedius]
MKQVMTGRGTGKTEQTVLMMQENKKLYTILPAYHYRLPIRYMCEKLELTKVETKEILDRTVTLSELLEYGLPVDSQIHIEEADTVLRGLLGIEFNTMTTSHQSVQKFEE